MGAAPTVKTLRQLLLGWMYSRHPVRPVRAGSAVTITRARARKRRTRMPDETQMTPAKKPRRRRNAEGQALDILKALKRARAAYVLEGNEPMQLLMHQLGAELSEKLLEKPADDGDK